MQPPKTPSVPRRIFPLAALSLAIVFVSACSSSSSTTPDTIPPDDDPTQTPGGPSVTPPDTATMFPDDTDNDDRPGMIVTGMNGMDPRDVVSPWLANVSLSRLDSETPGTGDGRVALLQYSDDFPVARHIEFFEESLDTCDIRDPDVPQPIGGGGGGGSPPPLLSGGTTVVINTPSGPWFTYDRSLDDDGEPIYRTDNQLPGALPQGATLSIPGDAFPTVAAHPLYEPDAPVRLLPDSEFVVTPESAYSWIPGSSGFTYAKINLLAYDTDDNFQGFYVTCYVEDDGEFTMPAAVVDYVANTEYLLVSRYSRNYTRLDLINGIVIYQDVEVAE